MPRQETLLHAQELTSRARLALALPSFDHDFPLGAGRYVQRAAGYDATIVNGQVFMEHGEHTGALAGLTLRS